MRKRILFLFLASVTTLELESIDEFVPESATLARIKDEYVTFYKTFKDMKYRRVLSGMPALGAQFLVVDFGDLLIFNSKLALNYRIHPETHLKLMREAALEVLSIENPSYAEELKVKQISFFCSCRKCIRRSYPPSIGTFFGESTW